MKQETNQTTKPAGMDMLNALMAAKFDEYVPRIPELKEGNKELIDGLVKAYGVLPDSPFTVMVCYGNRLYHGNKCGAGLL